MDDQWFSQFNGWALKYVFPCTVTYVLCPLMNASKTCISITGYLVVVSTIYCACGVDLIIRESGHQQE